MPTLTTDEVRRRMAAIHKEQMEQPHLSPNVDDDGTHSPFKETPARQTSGTDEFAFEFARV